VARIDDSGPRRPGAPLAGRSVIVTRAAEQAGSLTRALEGLGAEVLSLPVIEIAEPSDWRPVDAAIDGIGSYDWIVLTSVNGVDRFLDRLVERGHGVEALRIASVAVVGSATAARLTELGVTPAVVPAEYRAEGLVDAFRDMSCGPGWRVLVPRAEEAREVLPESLRGMGCTVDVVPVYRLVTARPVPEVLRRLAAGSVDAVTFASGGTARRFLEMLRGAWIDTAAALQRVTVASIGPVTSDGLRALGVRVDVEAAESTASSLVAALAARLVGGSAERGGNGCSTG
jgi:uroporphyrinogen III methyltransferase / synthase